MLEQLTKVEAGNVSECADLLMHPLFDHSSLVRTKPIEELYLAIKRIIILRETGCVFTGAHRVGKTDALDRVKAMLLEQYPSLCIYSHDAHNQQLPSIRAFFKHFLATVGHKNKRGETFDLRERLVLMLADDARVSGKNLVIFFIDEASALLIDDFLFLKDVYNDLSRMNVQLLTIMMGQAPDMQHVIDNLVASNRGDLVARFASRVSEFRALSTFDDLEMIMSGIDIKEFPAGSGITWTAFFLPLAYKGGFRMKSQTRHLMDAIESNLSGEAMKNLAFPAGALFLTIRNFLLDAAEYDTPDMELPNTTWSECVRNALLQEAMERLRGRHVATRKRGKK